MRLRYAGPVSAAAAFLLGAAPSEAQTPEGGAARPRRVHLHVAGGMGAAGGDVREDRTFREFAEDGSLRVSYGAAAGPSFEAGARFAVKPRLALGVAFALASRKNAAVYEASLPHPLHLGRHREVAGEVPGLAHREMAGHLDLVLTLAEGRLGAVIHGGPSLVGVRSRLLRAVQYAHEYPYDMVSVTSTPHTAFTDTGIGFSVGGAASWALRTKARTRSSVQGQLRYTRARVTLVPAEGNAVDVTAGGLAATLGLRFGL